jgi:hypothetical protein
MATFIKIASVTVGSGGAASMAFTSIPSTYTDLCLKVSARNTYASVSDWINIQFNSSTTGYSYRLLQGSGTTANSYSGSSQYSGDIDSANATASTFGSYELYLPNYAGSNYKSYSVDSVVENNATYAESNLLAGLLSNTAAIASVTVSPRNGTFVQYSTATLYGIKNS